MSNFYKISLSILIIISLFILCIKLNISHKIDLYNQRNIVTENLDVYKKSHEIFQKHKHNINSGFELQDGVFWIDRDQIEAIIVNDSIDEFNLLVELWDSNYVAGDFGNIMTTNNGITLFKYHQKEKFLRVNEYYVGIGSEQNIEVYINRKNNLLAIRQIDNNAVLMKKSFSYLW